MTNAAEEEGFLTVCLNPTLQKTLELSRLVPGEVNRALSRRMDASGKGVNVARVLLQFGETAVDHLCQCGGDSAHTDPDTALFFSLLAGFPVRLRTLRAVDSESCVRQCTTLLDTSAHCTTEIVEEGHLVRPGTDAAIRTAYLALLPHSHTVIISGSKAPGFEPNLFPWLVSTAKSANKRVICDYRGSDLIASLSSRPDIAKPNMAEFVDTFAAGLGPMLSLEDKVRERMAMIFQQYGTRCVITRGAQPTLYVAENGEVCSLTPIQLPADRIVNTIGCGDAFTAGLAAALHHGCTIAEAVAKGHDCGVRNAQLLPPGTIL